MENNELLAALQNLKKKIDSYESTQASIEKLKSRKSELMEKKEYMLERADAYSECKVEASIRGLPDAGAVPYRCRNLLSYDEKHLHPDIQPVEVPPAPSGKDKLIALGVGLAVWIAFLMVFSVVLPIIYSAVLYFKSQDMDRILNSLEEWMQKNQFAGLIWLGMIYGSLAVCEIIFYKIIIGKKIKATNKAVEYNKSIAVANANNRSNYQRQHSAERFNAYKKDVEEHNARHASNVAQYKSELESINNEIPRICSEITQRNETLKIIYDQIVADDTVPKKYKHPEEIEAFIDYIENRRADSLKEAINLYEKEKREDAHNEAMEAAAVSRARHARLQAQAAREAANAQSLAAIEARQHRIAAQEAAESAKKAADANQEALDILKDWDRKSD